MEEFCRAVLESVGFQSKDLLDAMIADAPNLKTSVLRVDGGMSASDWTMQFLANIIGAPVDRPKMLETTAFGVAWLAGMHVGFYPKIKEFSGSWSKDKTFESQMNDQVRQSLVNGWKLAIKRTLLK